MRIVPPLSFLMSLCVLAALGAGPGAVCAAPPGDLDPSFGVDGLVTTDFLGDDAANTVVVQPDGKLVVAGTRLIGGNLDVALARYDGDGTLDASFGSGGKTTTDFGATNDVLQAMVLQPDGKLVVLAADGFVLLLARYLDDGSLDPTFGFGGKVTANLGVSASDLALQSDGKLVVAGSANGVGQGDFALVRYLANGSLDPGFGTGGVVTTGFPSGRPDGARAVAVQPDGKLIAGGFSVNLSGTTDLALARYDDDGTLDASFGMGGLVLSHFGISDDMFDLALQSDGKIVAAGVVDFDSAAVRYLADGSLDVGFGDGGVAGFADGVFATTVAVDDQGYLAAAIETGISQAFVSRVRPDGSLDRAFGHAGNLAVDLFSFLGTGERDLGLALQPDGRIVVAGRPTGTADFSVARYFGDHPLPCTSVPAVGCKEAAARAATLKLQRKNGKPKLAWQWKHGGATTEADLGDPTAGDSLAVCVYDESAAPRLVSDMHAPSGGTCGASSCWRRERGPKIHYRDKSGAPTGVVALQVKAADAGHASLRMEASGADLLLPPLPSALPLRVQLQSTTGVCWESVFTAAGAKSNGPERFQGKSE